MYGPLYEHSDYVVLQQDLDALAEWESQVAHGIPSSEMQCPECIKIQIPFIPPPTS